MSKWRREYWELFPDCAKELGDWPGRSFAAALIVLRDLLDAKVREKDFDAIKSIMMFVARWRHANSEALGVACACFYEHCLESNDVEVLCFIRKFIPDDAKEIIAGFGYSHERVYGYKKGKPHRPR